jgi:FKBP-type peptidyl-prolyl cis-trans isomerase FkpA
MKIIKNYAVAFFCFLALACTEKETPGGVKYTLLRKGDGKVPEFGKFLALNLQMRDSKDSTWFNSKDLEFPVIIPVKDASIEKDEGELGVIKQLSVGDSVTFQLTAESVFQKTRRRAIPKNVDPKSLFTFNIGLIAVWTEEELTAKQQIAMEKNEKKQLKIDSAIIANHLAEKGIIANATASGLRYIIKKEGSGELIAPGKTALVHYAGYSLSGVIFDTSIGSIAKENGFDNGGRNAPYPVVVNTRSVIKGWDEMLMLMKKGTKVTVYIPSSLAYGPSGRGQQIPPNSVLVFDMEVMNVE